MRLADLTDYLDDYLRIREVPDSAGALNGLQVENHGEVTRIAAAVDASEAAIREAAARGCNLLLVHHGLFWDGNRPIVGRRFRRLRTLFEHDIALYSAHIPLDIHPDVGNNMILARQLGLAVEGWFGEYNDVLLGVHGTLETTRDQLTSTLSELLAGEVRLLPGGPEQVRRVGIVSGAAASLIAEARRLGLDAFISGEGSHHSYFDAMEEGINVYFGGHYATETWGVRALAEHLAQRFGLPWEFLHLPTGL